MKKISLMLMAVLGLAFVSCDDDSNAVPQHNPQLPPMTDADLALEAALPAAIDLVALNADNTPVEIGKVSECKNLPEGYNLKFVGQIGREESFKHVADFAIEVTDDNTLIAYPDALEEAYVAAVGKSAKTKEVYFRVAAYAEREKTDDYGAALVRIGGPDYYLCESKSAVTPLDLGIVIEAGYGLLGNINGWSVANAVPFHHSDEDVYDDPIFTLVVNISAAEAEDGWWWKVVPQTTIDAGNWQDVDNGSFGVLENGDSALEGNLIPRTATTDCGAGCVKTPGLYTLTLDMENQTYEFVPVFTSYLYTPGTLNNWQPANSIALFSVDDENYCGFAMFDGEFKFTTLPSWDGTNYGAGAEKNTISTAGGNLKADYDTYWYKVNLTALTYTVTPIVSVGVIGNFNGWGGQEELIMMSDMVYYGEVNLAGGEFKFRFNDNWDINLGGTPDLLVPDGANLTPAEDGVYEITLDLSTLPYTCTLVKK